MPSYLDNRTNIKQFGTSESGIAKGYSSVVSLFIPQMSISISSPVLTLAIVIFHLQLIRFTDINLYLHINFCSFIFRPQIFVPKSLSTVAKQHISSPCITFALDHLQYFSFSLNSGQNVEWLQASKTDYATYNKASHPIILNKSLLFIHCILISYTSQCPAGLRCAQVYRCSMWALLCAFPVSSYDACVRPHYGIVVLFSGVCVVFYLTITSLLITHLKKEQI